MDRAALVTGPRDRAAAAAAVLARRGWKVVDNGFGPLDCYLQMPDPTLSARVDVLAGIAPRLGRGATVLLAVEEGAAAPDLLAAMAQVVLEDAGRGDARVSVVPVTYLTA